MTLTFKPGDIFYTQEEGKYHLFKVLEVEEAFSTVHVLIYQAQNQLPDISQIQDWSIMAYHAPIDQNGFTNPVMLTNQGVKDQDLLGYHEYLRQTNNLDKLIALAQDYYKTAYDLTDQGQHEAAIEKYSLAMELIPAFYEAIDNRAFCKMDLGRWQEAIEDFQLSLQVNPQSLLAEFSIGECYLRMKNYSQAKLQFEKAKAIDPTHQTTLEFLAHVTKLMNGQN